jgi:hypothetical protein
METGNSYKASLTNYQWQWSQTPSDELVFMAYFQVSKNKNLGSIFSLTYNSAEGAHGDSVVEALRYKPEGRGIDSQWCH